MGPHCRIFTTLLKGKSKMSNIANKKFRPVFTADSLELLISLLDAAPHEMKCLPESKKLIHYLKGFSFKIEHEMVSPSAVLKGGVSNIPAKKSRQNMTQAELDAEAAEIDFDSLNRIIL